MANTTKDVSCGATTVRQTQARYIYPSNETTADDWHLSDSLAELPNGLLFNRRGVAAFMQAREEALSLGLDIEVVSALRSDPHMPLYPFRSQRMPAGAHHSTHSLERGAIGIDIDKWWQVKDILEKHGFRWRNHPDHPGHFDYLGHC